MGWADRSSTKRISRFVKRASPSAAPENSSIAHAMRSQIQQLTLSVDLWVMGWVKGIAKAVGNQKLSRPEWLACAEAIYEKIGE